jgi:hypothetical protein
LIEAPIARSIKEFTPENVSKIYGTKTGRAAMKITRLFTGTDQKSHFEDIELKFGGDQPLLTTDPRAASSAVFRSAPVGFERHPAPRRQFLVTLSGSWEIEASNGVKRVFKTGDVMLADDTSGEGHTRVCSATSRMFS